MPVHDQATLVDRQCCLIGPFNDKYFESDIFDEACPSKNRFCLFIFGRMFRFFHIVYTYIVQLLIFSIGNVIYNYFFTYNNFDIQIFILRTGPLTFRTRFVSVQFSLSHRFSGVCRW